MNQKLLWISFFTLVSFLGFAQEPKKVAVFDPTGIEDQSIIDVAREMLIHKIISSSKYVVLEREQIEQVLQENVYQHGGHVDDDQISELGKQMGADYVCVATVKKVESRYFFSARLVDVLSSQAVVSGIGVDEDIFVALEKTVNNLIDQERSFPLGYNRPNNVIKRSSDNSKPQQVKTNYQLTESPEILSNRNGSKTLIALMPDNKKITQGNFNQTVIARLSAYYIIANTHPETFNIKSNIKKWSIDNQVEYTLYFGVTGKKIVINIFDVGSNKYEYIYTNERIDSEIDINKLVMLIRKYID